MKVFYSLDPLKHEILAFIANCEEVQRERARKDSH